MDEDDDFGDLYAGLGGSGDAEAPRAPAAAPAPGFSLEEEDEDDYPGFGGDDSARVAAGGSLNNGSAKGAGNRGEEFSDNESGRNAAEGSESDSDDDLQIVLNNVKRAPPEAEAPALGESNEEAEEVPTANQPWLDEQSTLSDQVPASQPPLGVPLGGPPGILPPGLLPGDQVGAARPPVVNPGGPLRPPGKFMHHAQFKYVRAPMSGPAMNSAPGPGLGRGTFPPGPWGPGKGPPLLGSGPSRPWSGPGGYPHTEFHLPPTKTVFDMDLDAMDDKPWRNVTADITDYFNFGFNENSWRQYCQQLSQLRLEATMQSKISVYESGRSEQPIGRAIQVEGGVGERRPSYDLRRGRNRDSSDIIEIVLKDVEVETPVPFLDRMDMGESDYDMGHEQDGPDPRAGPLLGRNPYMDAEVPPFFPMGRPRGPYHRMFPGGFGGRGGVMRPPFYEPGMPPLPLQMRPEGFSVGAPNDFNEPRRASNRSSQGRAGLDEEHSSGSVAVKDDRKHSDSRDAKDDRRSRGSRDQAKAEDEEKSDEHKKPLSEDKHDQGRRYSDSRSQKEGHKKPSEVERSSYSDDEDHKSRHRSRKENNGEGDRHSWQAKAASDDKYKRSERGEKDQRKDEDWAKKSYRERDDVRWKEEEARRSRGKEEDVSRSSRREDEGRKRDKAEEYHSRKDREESWKRDRDRDDPQKRRSAYDDGYERRDRDEDRYSDRSRRHGYEEEDEYLRRRSKHSDRKDYRDEEEYSYDHRGGSSRGGREHSDDRYKEEERVYRDKYGWSSRGRDDSSRRNGSTSDYLDEKERKKRKTDDYQKSAHAEKVQARETTEDEAAAAVTTVAHEKKRSSRSEAHHGGRGGDDSYYSDEGDDDDKHRKGRSKMERLNRERPTIDDQEEKLGKVAARSQDPVKGSTTTLGGSSAASSGEKVDPFAKRRERFQSQKPDSSAEKTKKTNEKASIQADTSEFKHERPARKRRWA
ncbi:FIP1[V]-like protein [Selaginella moellendorffii]|uniref:FIP1[V]-like protein n=1 Tax=Selaginella moellendorffii TaxID=88036 RepID=UPI000D1CF7A3|nr:FIP1[V]-like protein [Selaginella moellendorffii]|eukprot:XP_024517307.1 FIP1[V]-like protein [Selaginella moellendorffii]